MFYCKTGYIRYIPGIYHVYTRHTMYIPDKDHLRARLVSSSYPRLEASDLDFLLIFSVLATESPHASLGAAKVPQPGADFVYMAAPPRGRLQNHIKTSTHNTFKFGTTLQKLALTNLLQYAE